MGYQAASHSRSQAPLFPPFDTHWLTLLVCSLLKQDRGVLLEVPGSHRFEKPEPHPGSHWPILFVLECLKQASSVFGVPSTPLLEGSFDPVLTPSTQPASSLFLFTQVLPCTTVQEGRVVNSHTHTSPEPIPSLGKAWISLHSGNSFSFLKATS